MDLESIISLLLYLGTFFIGFFLDKNLLESKYKNARKCFIVWLYIFLCFGYMTGSDWRGYELYYGIPSTSVRSYGEVGFFKMFYLISLLFKDYWLGVGFLKCLYLYTYIRVLKEITANYLSVVTLSLPICLCFILIDNPLRFMCALILVNVALSFLLKKKLLIFTVVIIAASILHTTALFFLLMLPCYILSRKIANTNQYLLLFLFIVTLYITSNITIITNVVGFFMKFSGMLNLKDYSHYMEGHEDGSRFFTVGSLIQVFCFILILYTKEIFKEKIDNGETIVGMAITYLFLQRFTLMIPTGFRLLIPFGIFYCLYIIYLKGISKKILYIFMTIIILQFTRTLYTAYVYIPYSNSIPFIISGHKDYNCRSMYNINSYKNRTGKDISLKE